jgi:hypothetical protein
VLNELSRAARGPVLMTLEVSSGPAAGRLIEVAAGVVVEIGRQTQALGDRHLSARHFAVACDGQQCRIRDLGSTNGTFVNGRQISEATLADGDRVGAGQSTFLVRLRRVEPAGPAGPPATTVAPMVSDPAPQPPTEPIPLCRIANETPFSVGMLRWMGVDGLARLTVVVKATFVLDPDVRPTPRQLPIFDADILTDQDPPSVRFESDRVPFKPRADVVLVGRAHAPDGKAVAELVAGLRVGDLRHGVLVVGDRRWEAQLLQAPTMSMPEPFVTMDLVYERAFGGFDQPAGMYCKENHAGTGFIGKRSIARVEGLRLPNLEDPRDPIRSWDSRPRPVGFGFYGRGWAPRLQYAGTYDEKHMKERHPLLPLDFSYRFFNGAHPDLQVEGYLRGDEEVDLLNVCPRAPRLSFRLPALVPKLSVSRWTVPPEPWLEERAGSGGSIVGPLPLVDEPLSPVLDTLVLVPEQGVFYEVFRAVGSLSSLDSPEIGRVTITL